MSCKSTTRAPSLFAAAFRCVTADDIRDMNRDRPQPFPLCSGCRMPVDPDGPDAGQVLCTDRCSTCEQIEIERLLRQVIDLPTRRKRRAALQAIWRLTEQVRAAGRSGGK